MKEKSVAVIIENRQGEILLLLRDDKSGIQYPDQWVILGGKVEKNEAPKEGMRREMKEEIEIELKDIELFKVFEWPEKTEYVYHVFLDMDIEKTNLHEGQKIQYFLKEETEKMDLAFHDNEIMRDFFAWRNRV